jgi:subtilisin family serine protease
MRYLLDFKIDTPDETIQEYCVAHGINIIKQFSKLGLVYEVSADAEPPVTDIIEYVTNDEVKTISLLNRESVSVVINPETDSDWWKVATLDILDYDQVSVTHYMNRTNIDVYIVDSGITASHPEFVGVDVENVYSYDGTFNDINGHGTAIASIIAGNTCSISNANLKIVKIFGETPLLQSHLLAAFDAIITRSVQSVIPSVVNLSWVIEKNPYIETKIQKLIDNNITVVCSAGNSGTPIPDVTPASMFDVITVGSYSQSFEPCDFSNYTGSGISVSPGAVNHGAIDIWSPGIDIKAANIDGTYHMVSGTSISSAIHSATIAFVYGIELSVDDPEFVLSTSRISGLVNDATLKKAVGSYRKNVLSLDGVYSSSVNRISTIFSKPELANRYVFDLTDSKLVGDAVDELIFQNRYITSFSLLEPLPTGLQILNGHLTGVIDSSCLTSEEDYKVFSANCQVETILGDITSSQINLLVKKNADISVEGFEDPEIMVFLQNGPGCPNQAFCPEFPCTAPAVKSSCMDTSTFGVCACL